MGLSFAVVCYNNMNRSMAAHKLLADKGMKVQSFGVGYEVGIPGLSEDSEPLYYEYGTTYDHMYAENKDANFHAEVGIHTMLTRNIMIKPRPERFQDCTDHFNIIVTCEEKVYDMVVHNLQTRHCDCENPTYAHVININIQDTQKGAEKGSAIIEELCTMIEELDNVDNEIDDLLIGFRHAHKIRILHQRVCY